MKIIAGFVSMLFLAGNVFAADVPRITRASRPGGDDIVRFQNDEAWEVVKNDWIKDGVYLNYSRFPWAQEQYGSEPVSVCYINTGGKRFVGVSEMPDRLQAALAVVITDVVGAGANTTTDCETLSQVFKRDPSFKDLRKFADSL